MPYFGGNCPARRRIISAFFLPSGDRFSVRMEKSRSRSSLEKNRLDCRIFRCRSIRAVGITSVSGWGTLAAASCWPSFALSPFCTTPCRQQAACLQTVWWLPAAPRPPTLPKVAVCARCCTRCPGAAFSRTFFAELCCLPAGQGGGAVLKAHPQLVRCVQAQRAEELFDIDTKEDLKTLQRRILND